MKRLILLKIERITRLSIFCWSIILLNACHTNSSLFGSYHATHKKELTSELKASSVRQTGIDTLDRMYAHDMEDVLTLALKYLSDEPYEFEGNMVGEGRLSYFRENENSIRSQLSEFPSFGDLAEYLFNYSPPPEPDPEPTLNENNTENFAFYDVNTKANVCANFAGQSNGCSMNMLGAAAAADWIEGFKSIICVNEAEVNLKDNGCPCKDMRNFRGALACASYDDNH